MKNLKLLGVLLVSFMVLGLNVFASEVSTEETLSACLTGTETSCTLKEDITLTSALELSGEKSIELNLNGKTLTVGGMNTIKDGYTLTITGNGKVEGKGSVALYLFRVLPGGSLKVINGTLENENTSGGLIRVLGSNTDTTTTTKVDVGSSAILRGTYGISIYGYNYDVDKKGFVAEGIEVDFAGTLETTSMGLTVNGNVDYTEKDYPIINIKDGAKITSSIGIYAAGYAKWNIGAATFNTVGTGIGIKAGQVYLDGAKVTTTGANNPNPTKWGNGMNASGSAIQIETNESYSDHIVLDIKSGEFVSRQGYSFLEYVGETNIVGLSISGGAFTSAEGLNVFKTTEKLDLTGKISGGTFSSDVNEYVKEGLYATKTDNGYVVGEPYVESEMEVLDPEKIEEVKEVTVGVIGNEKTDSIIAQSILKDDKLAEKTKDISVNVNVEIEAIKEENASEEVKTAMKAIKESAGKATVASFFDISILVKNTNTGESLGNVTNLTEEIELMILLPENLKNTDAKLNRNYYVLREHDGKVDTIKAELSKDGKYLVFKTDKFSTYALAYEDVAKVDVKVPQTADGITTAIIVGTLAIVSAAGICLYLKKQNA